MGMADGDDAGRKNNRSDGLGDNQSRIKHPWKNLGMRFISALAFALITFVPFYFGGPYWALMVAVLGSLVIWEWVRMSDPSPTRLAFIIPISGFLLAAYFTYVQDYNLTIGIMALAALVAAGERSRRGGLLWAGLGYFYIVIPALFLMSLRGMEAGIAAPGFILLSFIMLIVIAADTGAYFGGSYFKGAKMAPKFSPNKTWSGFFTGLAAGAFFGASGGIVLGFSPLYGIAMAVPIVIFSVLGDFLESGLKRTLDVKDAGGVLPGHGGLLDRLDSLMMVIVVVGVVLIFYPNLWPLAI